MTRSLYEISRVLCAIAVAGLVAFISNATGAEFFIMFFLVHNTLEKFQRMDEPPVRRPGAVPRQ